MTIPQMFLDGALLGAAWLLVVRRAGHRHAIRWHAAMLILAALAYVGFAAASGDAAGLVRELTGVLAFGALGVTAARRRSYGLLAIGWALHPLWDLAMHPGALNVGTLGGYAHLQYVVACMSFDWVVAWMLMRQTTPVLIGGELAA